MTDRAKAIAILAQQAEEIEKLELALASNILEAAAALEAQQKRIQKLEQERDALTQWVHDLQSGEQMIKGER